MSNNIDFKLKNAVEVGGPTKVTLGSITSSDIDLATGNYFADTLAANTTYTLSNAGDVQSFQLEATGGTVGYDLSSASYDNKSFDFSSQEGSCAGLAFNNDGSKVYMVSFGSDTIYQYSLSTAYDLGTASYDSVSFSVSSQDGTAVAVKFNNDGTKMYMGGYGSDTVYQYSLSTAFDLSTASYDSVSYDANSQDTLFRDMAFNSDGTKLYTIGTQNDSVYQHTLSTGFDVSTASYDSVSLDVSSEVANPFSVSISNDGTKMFVSGSSLIQQYDLSTAFDLSTASVGSQSYTDANVGSAVRGLLFNPDGTKMYFLSANVGYQYSTATDATITWPTSIEWAAGIAPSAPATGETDVFTFVTDDGGTSYVGLKTADNIS